MTGFHYFLYFCLSKTLKFDYKLVYNNIKKKIIFENYTINSFISFIVQDKFNFYIIYYDTQLEEFLRL